MKKRLAYTLLLALAIVTLFATNTLNAWHYGERYGIALNNIGGIDQTGLFVCPSAPFADFTPDLIVDC